VPAALEFLKQYGDESGEGVNALGNIELVNTFAACSQSRGDRAIDHAFKFQRYQDLIWQDERVSDAAMPGVLSGALLRLLVSQWFGNAQTNLINENLLLLVNCAQTIGLTASADGVREILTMAIAIGRGRSLDLATIVSSAPAAPRDSESWKSKRRVLDQLMVSVNQAVDAPK